LREICFEIWDAVAYVGGGAVEGYSEEVMYRRNRGVERSTYLSVEGV
jgi:hypothetical protein